MFKTLALTSLLLSFCVHSQKDIYLHFNPFVNNTLFTLNTDYTGLDGKVFNLDHFDYYISDVLLTHDGGNTSGNLDSNHIYLIEPDNYSIHLGSFSNVNTIDQLTFTVGVPSRYNTISGSNSQDISSYPSTHPLSFQSPSMYWGWSTGYMHMIVGGMVDSDNNGSADAGFQLHNLGNQNQQTVLQMPIIQTNSSGSKIDIYINCNIEQWLKNISLNSVGFLHGESGPNQLVLNNVSTEPVFTQPINAQNDFLSNSGIFFSHLSNNEIHLKWKDISNAYELTVVSVDGKLCESIKKINNNGSIILRNKKEGKYLCQLLNQKGGIIKTLNIYIP